MVRNLRSIYVEPVAYPFHFPASIDFPPLANNLHINFCIL